MDGTHTYCMGTEERGGGFGVTDSVINIIGAFGKTDMQSSY